MLNQYELGFEEVAERMMDREKWLKTAPYVATSKPSLGKPKDFDPENPDTVHDPDCPIKISDNVSLLVFDNVCTHYFCFRWNRSTNWSCQIPFFHPTVHVIPLSMTVQTVTRTTVR